MKRAHVTRTAAGYRGALTINGRLVAVTLRAFSNRNAAAVAALSLLTAAL